MTMGTVRDFSESAKQELLGIVQEEADEDAQYGFFSGIVDVFVDLGINGDIEAYQGDISAYYHGIVDKKNITADTINNIWKWVQCYESIHLTNLQNLRDELAALNNDINKLASAIGPAQEDGGISLLLRSPEELYAFLSQNLTAINKGLDLEQEYDRWLQQQVFALLEDPRLSQSQWDSLDEQGKRDFTNELLAEIQRIMGTSYSGTVIFKPLGDTTDGLFDQRGHMLIENLGKPDERLIVSDIEGCAITLNETILTDRDYGYERLAFDIIHEARHGYQAQCFVPGSSFPAVSEATRALWEANWQDVKNPDADGEKAYVTSPLEWDAYHFAKQDNQTNAYTVTFPNSWD
jgi:hypothetical protein